MLYKKAVEAGGTCLCVNRALMNDQIKLITLRRMLWNCRSNLESASCLFRK